jgi:hypothetical protein
MAIAAFAACSRTGAEEAKPEREQSYYDMTCVRAPCVGDTCSEPPICEAWQAVWPQPALDPRLYDACLKMANTCTPEEGSHAYCNIVARWLKPEVTAAFECEVEHGCSQLEACGLPTSPGEPTLAKYCQRAASCNQPCVVGPHIPLEGWLRPELERGLRQCMAEASCSRFEACNGALAQASVVLGSEKMSPFPREP